MAKPKKIKLNDKDNTVSYGKQNDVVYGNGGDDVISGGAGNDKLYGGDGNDILRGGADDDRLSGGAGDDRLLGGAGDDYIIASVGNDTVDGGAGDDIVSFGKVNLADVTVTKDGDYYVITNGDQVTKVKNVELYKFADGTVGEAKIEELSNGGNGPSNTLTTAVDNIVGTDANEVIIGVVDGNTPANSTLTAADKIEGGAGTDTLQVTVVAGGDALGGAAITGVEAVVVRAIDGGTAEIDANNAVGLVTVTNNLSTSDLEISNFADKAVVNVNGNGVVQNGDTTVDYAAAATTAALNLSGGVNGGDVHVDGAALTSVTFSSAGAVNTVNDLVVTPAATAVTINASSALNTGVVSVGTGTTEQTLKIAGAAANQAATATAAATGAVVVGTLDADFDVVDASGLTAGGISATIGSLTAKVTGGAGADIITTGGVLTTGSVNAGAGTDRLVLAASADLATAALGAKYTNFEQLQVQNNQTANLANIAGITSLFLNDGAGAATVLDNLSAAQAGAITVLAGDGAATINVTGASTVGQLDTVALTFDNGNTTKNEDINNTASTFTLTGVETLSVTAVDKVEIVQSAAASASLTSVVLAGAGDISFTTGNIATTNFAINASAATGTNTIDASDFLTNGVSITGGTGADTITGSDQNDIINGGAGADVISGGLGVDTLTGGEGADKFVFATAEFATTEATADIITDFLSGTDKLVFNGATTAMTAANYNEATTAVANFAAAATAADASFVANAGDTVSFQFDGTNGYVFIDTDNDQSFDQVVILKGVDATEFASTDIFL